MNKSLNGHTKDLWAHLHQNTISCCTSQVAMPIAIKHAAIILNPIHVKSHQDDTVAYKNSPWKAKLNFEVEKLAEAAHTCLTCNPGHPATCMLLPGHGAKAILDTTEFTHHLSMVIREASYQEEFKTYILAKTGWDTMVYNQVDWPDCHQARGQSPMTQNTTICRMEDI